MLGATGGTGGFLDGPIGAERGLLIVAEQVDVEFVANDTIEGGSQDDVESEDDVEAESLPQEDSKLDSVSVEPVLPIDIVLPICIPMAFIGFDSKIIIGNWILDKVKK